MSKQTPFSSLCIETYCNSTILCQLQKLSRAGQRLLLLSLSRLTNLDNSYLNRSVIVPFSVYCSFIQQPYNNQMIHGTVRNAFYNIKSNCELIDVSKSVYSELTQSVSIVFKQEFIKTLTESDHISLPMDLFIADRGEYMPNYPLILAIYSKAAKAKSKKIEMPVRDIIALFGGKYSDYHNPPKYWKKAYVERISNMLHKFKILGLIKSYGFLLGEDKGIDLNSCYEKPDNGPDNQQSLMISNYEKMTRYYRTYMEVVAVIKI